MSGDLDQPIPDLLHALSISPADMVEASLSMSSASQLSTPTDQPSPIPPSTTVSTAFKSIPKAVVSLPSSVSSALSGILSPPSNSSSPRLEPLLFRRGLHLLRQRLQS